MPNAVEQRVPVGARGAKPVIASRLQLTSPDVLVTGIEPSDDGRALMVRLWGAAGREARTDLVWSQPGPRQLWLSDTSQQPIRKLEGPVTVPAWGVVTVRAELGK